MCFFRKLICISFLLIITSLNVFSQDLSYAKNWNETLTIANKLDKKILLVLYKENTCEPVKTNLKKLFNDLYFKSIAKDYIIFKLEDKNFDFTSKNATDFKYFVKKYNIVNLPSMIIFDSKGKRIKNISGCVACRKNVVQQLKPNNPFLN